MPEVLLHVFRGDTELGAFAPDEVRELLEAGFLKPGDEASIGGHPQRGPLQEALAALAGQPPTKDWRDRVVAGSTAFSRMLGRRAGRFVAEVRAHAAANQETLSRAKEAVLNQFLPQIQKLLAIHLRDKPAGFAQQALRDEETMRRVFAALYDCLPRPICRFVSEPIFVGFCLEHRLKLLGARTPAAEPPASATAPEQAGPAGRDPA